VRAIADFNRNIVPHFITQSDGPIPEKIAELVRSTGQLGGATMSCLWSFDMYAAVRSAGHNVMLGGDGGNTTMSYDGYGLFTELLLTGRWLKLFAEIRSSGYRWRRHLRHMVFRPLVPLPVFRRYKQWRRGQNPPWHNYSFMRPEFAARTQVIDRADREDQPFDTPPLRDTRLGRIRDFGVYCELADWFVMVRARFGIDIRAPAFDRRLVEFCIGIPQDQYLRKGHDRWLIRRAMQGRLPDIVLSKTKYGTQSADWFPRLTRQRSLIAEEVKRLAKNPEVASILDMQRLNAILRNWPDRQPPEYTLEAANLLSVPDALHAAYLIEAVIGANYRVLQSGNTGLK
jgi:asparagine synthase (glutamine-hydrolysing)